MSKYYLIRNLTDNLNEIWGYQSLKYDSSYSCMLHFDDDILKDEISGNEWEIFRGNPTLTTQNAKFGKAIYFDGSSAIKLKNGLTLGGGISLSTFGLAIQIWVADTGCLLVLTPLEVHKVQVI